MIRAAAPHPASPHLATSGTAAVPHPGTAAHAHRLRLCQELQLDALRLSFTTALLEARSGRQAGSDLKDGSPELLYRPWRRWMVEDLDRALDLATAMAELSAEPAPFGLGDRPGARTAGEEAEEDLVVHYRTMLALLRELLDGVRPLEPESTRRTVESVLARVEQRIHDLGADTDEMTVRTA